MRRVLFIKRAALALPVLLFIFTTFMVLNQRSKFGRDFVKFSTFVEKAKLATESNHKFQVSAKSSSLARLRCSLRDDDEPEKSCVKDGSDEVYLPFNKFLKNQYETFGNLTKLSNGEEIFVFRHSNSKIIKPTFKIYDPRGVYGSFASYNVENRCRVKLISAIDGVPLSVQWSSKPYHYPTQIAQYALEHYSKNITVNSLLPEVLHELLGQWQFKSGFGTTLTSIYDTHFRADVIKFNVDDKFPANLSFYNSENTQKWPIFRLFATFDSNRPSSDDSKHGTSGFMVTVHAKIFDAENFFHVYYVSTDHLIWVEKPNKIFYGIGAKPNFWRRYTRNIVTDFAKGFSLLAPTNKSKMAATSLRVVSISLLGSGRLFRLSQRPMSHDDHFFDAVDFLVGRQDSADGGLAANVSRKIAGGALHLKPGWRSAMAQGHFLSAVCRAYASTGLEKYRKAALLAARLFDVEAASNGVRALFLNSSVWYEEYPTVPHGTFVLNGFIYSLIGLYDSWKLCQDDGTAQRLYRQGLKSLRALLPLYDTGCGSLYDLKHISFGGQMAPNVARWEYHTVHVYQLHWMHGITADPIFLSTAVRWEGYAKGRRAKHN